MSKWVFILLASVTVTWAQTCPGIPTGYSLGPNQGNLNGFVPFPSSAFLHRDVTGLTIDPDSAAYVDDLRNSFDRRILPLLPQPQALNLSYDGFPYYIVPGTQRRVMVYGPDPDSDKGPVPIPTAAIQEGATVLGNPFPQYATAAMQDAVLIILDKDNCVLYEMSATIWDGHNWHAGFIAVFDLLGGDNQRPTFWSAASVSGIPIFGMLLRAEEIRPSSPVPINHTIAFTAGGYPPGTTHFHHSFVLPASNAQSGTTPVPWWVPSETRFGSVWRMSSLFDCSMYPAQTQLLCTGMKQYGISFVDGGNTIDLRGTMTPLWDQASWNEMHDNMRLTDGPNNFDVITMPANTYGDPNYVAPNNLFGNPHLPAVPFDARFIPPNTPPMISSFTANPSTIHVGDATTLSWSDSGAGGRIRIISANPIGESLGEVGCNGVGIATSAVASPVVTTTYTLSVKNITAETTANVTVTVLP